MPEIFVATSGRPNVNPVTRDVRIDFENKELDEITIQLSLQNLQLLAQQAAEEIGTSHPSPMSGDPLPLGGTYRISGHVVSKTPSGVRLAIHLASDTGQRFLHMNLSPQEASVLADDLYEKATPVISG